MRRLLLSAMAVLAFPTVAPAQMSGGGADSVVLTFTMTGGQKPRKGDGPIIEILADGTIFVRGQQPGAPRIRSKLSESAQEALLRAIVKDADFLDISNEDIQAELSDAKMRSRRTADAPTTVISVVLPEGQNTVSIYGVSAMVAQAPDSPKLHQLYQIQTMLLQLARELQGA